MGDFDESLAARSGIKHCICDNTDYSTFMICCDKCLIWYHGQCMKVTPGQSKRIKKYFCLLCVKKDNSLEIVYKKEKRERSEVREASNSDGAKSEEDEICTKPPPRCGECIGCFRTSDCEKCDNCTAEQRKPCIKRKCVQVDTQKAVLTILKQAKKEFNASESNRSTPTPKPPVEQPVRPMKKRGRKRKIFKLNEDDPDSVTDKKYVRRQESVSEKKARIGSVYNAFYAAKKRGLIKPVAEEDEQLQCYGPKCVKVARKGSKYCSDECGMALAELRVRHILTARVLDYFKEQPAQDRLIYQKKKALDDEEKVLNDEHERLNKYADAFHKYITMIGDMEPAESNTEKNSVDDSYIACCPVCASEVPVNNIAKHSQRCYVRSEKGMNYGAAEKVPINPHNIICDFYGKSKGSNVMTYCRRLRVLCPEHYKPEKDELKICGCPLKWGSGYSFKQLLSELAQSAEVDVCRKKKSNCEEHFNWAQTMLGLIDNERMNILLRLDNIVERNKDLAYDYQNRADVLSLLCNWRTPGPASDESMERICGLPQNDTYKGPDEDRLETIKSSAFPEYVVKTEEIKYPVDEIEDKPPSVSSLSSVNSSPPSNGAVEKHEPSEGLGSPKAMDINIEPLATPLQILAAAADSLSPKIPVNV